MRSVANVSSEDDAVIILDYFKSADRADSISPDCFCFWVTWYHELRGHQMKEFVSFPSRRDIMGAACNSCHACCMLTTPRVTEIGYNTLREPTAFRKGLLIDGTPYPSQCLNSRAYCWSLPRARGSLAMPPGNVGAEVARTKKARRRFSKVFQPRGQCLRHAPTSQVPTPTGGGYHLIFPAYLLRKKCLERSSMAHPASRACPAPRTQDCLLLTTAGSRFAMLRDRCPFSCSAEHQPHFAKQNRT